MSFCYVFKSVLFGVLKVGKHGIRIEFPNEKNHRKTATYLPEVAVEQSEIFWYYLWEIELWYTDDCYLAYGNVGKFYSLTHSGILLLQKYDYPLDRDVYVRSLYCRLKHNIDLQRIIRLA